MTYFKDTNGKGSDIRWVQPQNLGIRGMSLKPFCCHLFREGGDCQHPGSNSEELDGKHNTSSELCRLLNSVFYFCTHKNCQLSRGPAGFNTTCHDLDCVDETFYTTPQKISPSRDTNLDPPFYTGLLDHSGLFLGQTLSTVSYQHLLRGYAGKILLKNLQERQDSNLVPLDEKRERFLCAMPSPLHQKYFVVPAWRALLLDFRPLICTR